MKGSYTVEANFGATKWLKIPWTLAISSRALSVLLSIDSLAYIEDHVPVANSEQLELLVPRIRGTGEY